MRDSDRISDDAPLYALIILGMCSAAVIAIIGVLLVTFW